MSDGTWNFSPLRERKLVRYRDPIPTPTQMGFDLLIGVGIAIGIGIDFFSRGLGPSRSTGMKKPADPEGPAGFLFADGLV